MKKAVLVLLGVVWLLYQSVHAQNMSVPPGTRFTIWLTSGNIDLKNTCLFLNKNGDPVFQTGERGYVLVPAPDSVKACAYKYPEGVLPEMPVYMDNTIVFKEKEKIRQLTDEGVMDLMNMPTGNFAIFPASGTTFYLVMDNSSGGSDLFVVNGYSRESLKLISFVTKITDVAGNGLISFIASDDRIYYLSKENSGLACISDTPVRSLAVSEEGVFYASASGVYYLTAPGKSYPVSSAAIRKVLVRGDQLYMLSDDGVFSEIGPVHGFEDMVREIKD